MNQRPTILLVEDETAIRQNIVELLTIEHFNVVALESANGAMALAKSLKPGLILADIMMHGKDGYQLAEELLADPETQDTPIVFITARGTKNDIRTGLDLGVADYLVKPFSAASLLHVVRMRMRKRQQAQDRYAKLGIGAERQLIGTLIFSRLQTLRIAAGLTKIIADYGPEMVPQTIHRYATEAAACGFDLERFMTNLGILTSPLEIEALSESPSAPYEVGSFIGSIAQAVANRHARPDELQISTETALVNAPPSVLNKIITELADNAFRYSPKGTTVRIVGQSIPSAYKIKIEDSGVGIDQAVITSLQEEFPSWKVQPVRPLGIGLKVAHSLVARLESQLTLTSLSPDGTSAEFEFASDLGRA